MATPGVNAPGVPPAITAAVFQLDSFVVRQKTFSLAPCFYIRDRMGNTLAFLRRKVFTWKDEVRVFTDATHSLELLRIKARKIVDWGAAFDVTDSVNHQKIGTVKRPGWGSVMRREWIILDAIDQEIGRMRQDSASLALIRSFVTTLLPQSFSFMVAEKTVGTAKGSWNLFAPRMVVDFSRDPERKLDRRLAIAGVVLLITIEGRLRWYD